MQFIATVQLPPSCGMAGGHAEPLPAVPPLLRPPPVPCAPPFELAPAAALPPPETLPPVDSPPPPVVPPCAIGSPALPPSDSAPPPDGLPPFAAPPLAAPPLPLVPSQPCSANQIGTKPIAPSVLFPAFARITILLANCRHQPRSSRSAPGLLTATRRPARAHADAK